MVINFFLLTVLVCFFIGGTLKFVDWLLKKEFKEELKENVNFNQFSRYNA